MSDIIPQDATPLKRCPTCPEGQQWHPATPEYFYHSKNEKCGLTNKCKECTKRYQRERYRKPEVRERTIRHQLEYQNQPGVRDRINRRRSSQEGRKKRREQDRRYKSNPEIRARRRVQQRRYASKYYHKNELKMRKMYREKYGTEYQRQRQHRYRSHPEVQERLREYKRAYESRPEVRAKRRVRDTLRRARRQKIGGTHTAEQIKEMLHRHHYKCYYCGEPLKQVNGKYIYHRDHTFPLSRVEGKDIPANSIDYLVPACPKCNLKKGKKFPWEFFEGGRLL